jgi:predicted nucleic acid-binding protein
MVFVQAASRPGGPAARLFIEFLEAGNLTLYVSDAVLAEVRDVLGRPSIRAKNPAITDDRVEAFLRRIDQAAQRIEPAARPSFYLPTPGAISARYQDH